MFACLQLAHLAYLICSRPLTDREAGRQEVQNELITILCLYAMMTMANRSSPLTGWLFVALFTSYIVVNAAQMLYTSVKQLFRRYQIWMAKRKERARSKVVIEFIKQSKLRQLRKMKLAQRLHDVPDSESSEEDGDEESHRSKPAGAVIQDEPSCNAKEEII